MKSYLVAIGFLAVLSTTYFFHSFDPNIESRMDTIRALVEQNQVYIDDYAGNTRDVIQWNGHIYSNKAPYFTLTALIPYFVFNKIWPEKSALLTSLFVMAVNSFFLVSLMFLILVEKGETFQRASLLSCLVFLGTPLFPFSTVFYSHAFSAMMLLAAFFFGIKNKFFLCGLFASIGFGSEFTAVLFIPAILFYFFLEKKLTALNILRLLSGIFIAMIPLLFWNKLVFGELLFNPYAHFPPAPDSGALGFNWPFVSKSFWDGTREVLFKSQRGIFFLCPITLAYIFGFRRKSNEVLFATTVLAFFVVVNCSYGKDIYYWGGAFSFGPRYLIPALPFLIFPINYFFRRSWIVFLVTGVSIFNCLLAAAINPRIPLGHSNVISQYLWPELVKGALVPNLGTALGMQHPSSLLPLIFGWSYFLKRNIGDSAI